MVENTKFYEKGEHYSYCIRKKRMCIKYSKNYRNLCGFFAQIPAKCQYIRSMGIQSKSFRMRIESFM